MKRTRIWAALVILVAATARVVAIPERGSWRLLLWGFDQILAGEMHHGELKAVPIPLKGNTGDIAGVSAVGDRLALIRIGVKSAVPEREIVIFSLPTGLPVAVVTIPARSLAVAPDGGSVGFTAYAGRRGDTDVYDVGIWSQATGKTRVLAPKVASATTSLTWGSRSDEIAFDGLDGWITSLKVQDGSRRRLVRGQAPAWSPDGRRLAYFRDQSLNLYDPDRGGSAELFRRHFWQTDFVGPIFWKPDGSQLAINVNAGIWGMELRCVLVELSGEAKSVYKGSRWCGPWLGAVYLVTPASKSE